MTFRNSVPGMYLLAACLVLISSHSVRSAEQTEHRDFQYNSVVDPATGRYNFAYDTGNDNEMAHSMHMQYRDANGLVRGRYGYTDPRGKLRVVEYEAGPGGFVARGDVGPDQSLHEQTPEVQSSPQLASYTQEDLQLDPRPVQMAGWDPLQNPMGQAISDASSQGGIGTNGVDSTTNSTNGDVIEAYVPVFDPYDDRYPRIAISTNENPTGRELESLSVETSTDQSKPESTAEPYPVAPPLTVDKIDVDPDDIRESASGRVTVARSADSSSGSGSSRVLPYSYRNYWRQTHDHDGEIAYPYRSVYVPSHGHYHYTRQPHDHDAERRYYINRQTHDHDAERRYYLNRQTHDHDAERRYYLNRQTHDRDAERARYYSTIHRQNNPHRRRIFYKDNHSMVPHEHYNDVYYNDPAHRHSDVHLYGTSQNLQVPPTAKPGELKYISSDKYHDKYYYWAA